VQERGKDHSILADTFETVSLSHQSTATTDTYLSPDVTCDESICSLDDDPCTSLLWSPSPCLMEEMAHAVEHDDVKLLIR
jgi:hypothetical protein